MRIAQILNNRVHWIFEADKIPEYPPDASGNPIVFLDITEVKEVQEGWVYDEIIGKFSEPVPVEPEPLEPTETELLQGYVVDVDFRLAMIELGF